MTIHSATDHGYTTEPVGLTVWPGATFRLICALGIYESRVLRRHRTPGYYETVFERWITEVPQFRQGFVRGIFVLSEKTILEAMRAA